MALVAVVESAVLALVALAAQSDHMAAVAVGPEAEPGSDCSGRRLSSVSFLLLLLLDVSMN